MILSLCIPCMNRTYALKTALPLIIKAANASPPCEIVICNYSSTDDLEEYFFSVKNDLVGDNFWTIVNVSGQKYFSISHAKNASVKPSCGEYSIQLSAEALPIENAFQSIRSIIEQKRPVWMCEGYVGRFVVCEREEFISSGGYDERFNVYAPDDKDFCLRLHRRGGKFIQYSPHLIGEIYTPNEDKLLYIDKSIFATKQQMGQAMKQIYYANIDLGILVANYGVEWGKYD